MKLYFFKYKEIIFITLLMLAIYLYVNSQRESVEKDGILILTRYDFFESAPDGSFSHFTFFWGGDSTKVRIDTPEGNFKKGKYYFAKVLKRNPAAYPLFYLDKEVPRCLLNQKIPEHGWEDFPLCK